MITLNELLVALVLQFSQPAQTPSIALDPATPGATAVHWTITLSAPYCGGFRLGDGVYVQPEAPLTLPKTVAPEGVLFNGSPADASIRDGVLKIVPSTTLMQSMLCEQGDRAFTVELLGTLGLANPDAGAYAVDVWVDAGGTPEQLAVSIVDSTSACDSLGQQVEEAAATLRQDNTTLATTFDAIRAQSTEIHNPGSAAAQARLLAELARVQARRQELASTPGWNPLIAYAVPSAEWAQGPALTDIMELQQAAADADPATLASLTTLISLVGVAQQQAQAGDTASQRYFDVLQQFGDCGLGTPPAH